MSIKILCIETSTDVCSVCLSVNGEVKGLKEFQEFRHSSHLLPLILDSLDSAGLVKKDLDAICLSQGPGSYTGLRVGSSTAKGFAFALDIPLIAIDSLKGLAFGLLNKLSQDDGDIVIMPMMDARRDEVYTAQFNVSLECILPTQPILLDHYFLDRLAENKTFYLCGNGAKKAEELCKNKTNIKIIPTICSAQYFSNLCIESYNEKQFETLDHFEPNYLKPPKITKPKSLLL